MQSPTQGLTAGGTPSWFAFTTVLVTWSRRSNTGAISILTHKLDIANYQLGRLAVILRLQRKAFALGGGLYGTFPEKLIFM
jgi:hypothetical protein